MATIVTLQDALAGGVVRDRCSASGLEGYKVVARAVLDDESLGERLAWLMDEWLTASRDAEDLFAVTQAARPWGLTAIGVVALRGGPGPGLLLERDKATEHWQWLHAIASDPEVARSVSAMPDMRPSSDT